MKFFKLYWKDGRTEVIKGKTYADALAWAGYDSAGCHLSLDYYEEVEPTWKAIH